MAEQQIRGTYQWMWTLVVRCHTTRSHRLLESLLQHVNPLWLKRLFERNAAVGSWVDLLLKLFGRNLFHWR